MQTTDTIIATEIRDTQYPYICQEMLINLPKYRIKDNLGKTYRCDLYCLNDIAQQTS